MAITAPYSLDLGPHEDAKHATPGTTVTVVAGNMKIFISSAVNEKRTQAIVGSLKSIFRHMMNEDLRKAGGTADFIGFGNWASASSGNITVNTDGTGITTSDVAISLSSTFDNGGSTHLYKETFDQLINVLLEKMKGN